MLTTASMILDTISNDRDVNISLSIVIDGKTDAHFLNGDFL